MIEITKHSAGFTITGHAGYAPPGQDIVCAGISALLQTLVSSIEQLTDDKIEYSLKEGNAEVKFRNLSDRAQVLMDSFFIGVEMIAESYPDNVCLRREDIKPTVNTSEGKHLKMED